MRRLFSILKVLIIYCFISNNLTGQLIIQPTTYLPKDSIETKKLISAINGFLAAVDKPNEENPFISESEKLESFLLIDEMKGISKSGKYKDEYFYKPYLTNLVPLDEVRYTIQISYIGVYESQPTLRASFELIAHRQDDEYTFSSPLLSNTKYWKTENRGNNIFKYQGQINVENIDLFETLAIQFDKKLNSQDKVTEFYCIDNTLELQKLVGVNYKLDYNGRSESVWSSQLGNKKIILMGNDNAQFDLMDPHDLWHDRLSLVIPRSKVNRPVDEGIAYLYAGSWGLTWEEIFNEFAAQVALNKSTDWKAAKEESINFTTKGFNNSVDYIVNALLVKKIEKEKGFEGVWKLLNVGPFEKGNEKYYSTLKELTGISKDNYNEAVWQLIAQEANSLAN